MTKYLEPRPDPPKQRPKKGHPWKTHMPGWLSEKSKHTDYAKVKRIENGKTRK